MKSSQQNNPDLEAIRNVLQSKNIHQPDCAVILGSGLGSFSSTLENSVSIPYSDIPGFPLTHVAGHEGTLYAGFIGGKSVLAWSGRFHLYEGHPLEKTLLPVHISHNLGCKALIVTNAAGGINIRFQVGDLMMIDDLLTGPGSLNPYNQRFLKRYSPENMINHITRLAVQQGISVNRGTYIFTKGPTYETKAEVRAFRTMGADAAGMSTAAELIEATRLNMTCIGISLITNKATGVSKEKLSHSDIKDAASQSEKTFISLLTTLIAHKETPLYSSP